jgi:hypothetical protein
MPGVDMTSGVKGYCVSKSDDGLFSLSYPDYSPTIGREGASNRDG